MAADRHQPSSAGPLRVLVTGATSGIGLATTVRFAAAGARVAALGRGRAGLEAARGRTAAVGPECVAIEADLAERDQLEVAIEQAAERLGGLDVVVANVGAATYGFVTDTPPRDFDRVVDVTFRTTADTIRQALPHLERSGGSMTVVGSLASEIPLPMMSAYTAAKHAVRGLVGTLRIELRAQGSAVAVCLVEPGPIDTPFWVNVAVRGGRLPPRIPFIYRPEEVAIAVEDASLERTPHTSIGAQWVLARWAYRGLRPLSERIMAALIPLARRLGSDGEGRGGIWRPSGEGTESLGALARPSLQVRARHLLRSGRRR